MGTYITHEGLPFHGNLKKIRIRSCRATDPSLPGFDEEQLLEITQNGEVKLTQKTPTGTEKTKTRISQADADHIFAAFSEVFASYRREHIPSLSGHWRVRLLTDNNEVYFYHGANGQDYRYHDESLTDILRQRTGMQKLFGLSVKAETKSKVKSIEISLEQTATDEVKDKYASEYGICIHDINEWLLVSSEGTLTYNRRIAKIGRVSLQYELKDKVAEFLKLYEDRDVFSRPKGNSPDTVQNEIRKTYKIVVTRDDGESSVLEGSFDKAVCLMDLADDFGVHDDAQYLETYETAIAFAKEHPDTLWCYGNHDLSYIWGKPETGYHPEKRGLVCQEIKKLTNTLPKKSQLAYIHKIDKTLFMHGGLANLFVQLRVAPQNRKNVLAVIKVINQMGCETMWAADSPIWYRPQLSPNQNAKRLYRGGKYLQVVGHTPVKEVHLEDGVLSCDTFSTYRDGTPYGSQAFCIVDTITLEFETVKGG